MKDFTYNCSEQKWEEGTIYDPESGKTYYCYRWLDGNNRLKVKGFSEHEITGPGNRVDP